jgi:hypothetical protein
VDLWKYWVDLLHFRDSLTPSNETFGSISGSIGNIWVDFWKYCADFLSFLGEIL